jgi:hypothetical protein
MATKALSLEAESVLAQGKKLWAAYFEHTDAHRVRKTWHLDRSDVGWYQIRNVLKERTASGDFPPVDWKPFEAAYEELSVKLRAQVEGGACARFSCSDAVPGCVQARYSAVTRRQRRSSPAPTAWCTALAAAKLAGGCANSRWLTRLSCCRERGHRRLRQRQSIDAAQALHHPQRPVLALRAAQHIHARPPTRACAPCSVVLRDPVVDLLGLVMILDLYKQGLSVSAIAQRTGLLRAPKRGYEKRPDGKDEEGADVSCCSASHVQSLPRLLATRGR